MPAYPLSRQPLGPLRPTATNWLKRLFAEPMVGNKEVFDFFDYSQLEIF
jgi:hypothetical protein